MNNSKGNSVESQNCSAASCYAESIAQFTTSDTDWLVVITSMKNMSPPTKQLEIMFFCSSIHYEKWFPVSSRGLSMDQSFDVGNRGVPINHGELKLLSANNWSINESSQLHPKRSHFKRRPLRNLLIAHTPHHQWVTNHYKQYIAICQLTD